MNEVYLEVYSLAEACVAPIETIVTLFTISYCDSKMNVRLVPSKPKPREHQYKIDLSKLAYEVIDLERIPHSVRSCELPIVSVDKANCIAGLCATLRRIVKDVVAEHPKHYCRKLLGFKDSCLMACSEASVWTRFCELDLIRTVKFLYAQDAVQSELPQSMALFECHMSHPVRLHNLCKHIMSKKLSKENIVTDRGRPQLPEHVYAEGSSVTLADIIIFVCVHVLLSVFPNETIARLLPLTKKWYERMIGDQLVLKCLRYLPALGDKNRTFPDCKFPCVPNQSLYKSNPKGCKPRNRVYTKQEDVEESLELIRNSGIEIRTEAEPFGVEMSLDWSAIPYEATPEGGSLPPARLRKKQQQLENMCKSVLKLAKPGDTIVDFCSGSGHLGILVAYLLPQCFVILLDNKEESLSRAKSRVEKLNLTNVKLYQCNLVYFKGDFDIGMSLHACGVATDLVIERCIRKNAAFVSCPCCYGSLRDCHHLTYPRSETFKTRIEQSNYLILSHAADQTHDEQNLKTKQGCRCMAIIDTDRKLQAEQFNYRVHLARFVPDTCTPKNHMLVGIPEERITDRRNVQSF